MSKRMVVALGLALVASSSMVLAQEQKIERSEVPSAVLKAVEARYPDARIGQFEKENEGGRLVYEVQLEVDGKHSEVSVSPEGKVLVEEATIGIQDVPEVVRKGLASTRYASANVIRVEKVTETDKADATTFEIVVEQSGERHDLVFDRSGALKKEEPAGKKKG
jgi:Peptidase propeptide and YPEB domain